LQRLLEEFASLAEKKAIGMRLDCPESAMVNTDGTLLERMIRNLVTNAINHNSRCDLVLQVVPAGSQWRLVVKDTGRGIDPSQHEHIFEEFYQLENRERDRTKGLGLGLSIVRRLSELLELDMQFRSVPGEGTEFGFTIDAAKPAETTGAAAAPVLPSRELLRSLLVLVVDDEKSVREGMSSLLGNLGCRVMTAEDTGKALAAAAEQEPDIALVDARLRDRDSGLDTIKGLRELYPGLPAVIISGDTAPDRLLEFDRAKIPVLVKPVLVGPLQEALVENCFPAAVRTRDGVGGTSA
jgi:CheY-like chemotaxis protein